MSPQHAHSWVVEFQFHNRGHRNTRLCPSSVLDVLRHIPCLSACSLFATAPSLIRPSPPPHPSPMLPAALHPLVWYPPIPTILEQPRPPVFAPSYRRVPEPVVLQCIAWPCSASLRYMPLSPQILPPPSLSPEVGITPPPPLPSQICLL